MSEEVPIEGCVRNALLQCAPHVADEKYGTILSSRRTRILLFADAVIVKYGQHALEFEAEFMRFVSERTSVPLPNLFGIHVEDGVTFLVMEFIPGETLLSMWKTLDEVTKLRLSSEFDGYVSQLREIPGSYIGSFGRRPCDEVGFASPALGPFDTEDEMNKAMIYAYEQSIPGHFGSMLKSMLQTGHSIVFSHGDLHMENILVRNGRIVAILDWEKAGFYPEYWDYAIATVGAKWDRSMDWKLYLQKSLRPYFYEASVFSILIRVVFCADSIIPQQEVFSEN